MEEKKEEREEIVVLDEGIELEEILGPDWICCYIQLIPFR